MITEEMLVQLLVSAPIILVKVFSIILTIFHLVFSAVLVKQTKLMIAVLEARISPAIYAISIIHFLASLFVLIWAIFVL